MVLRTPPSVCNRYALIGIASHQWEKATTKNKKLGLLGIQYMLLGRQVNMVSAHVTVRITKRKIVRDTQYTFLDQAPLCLGRLVSFNVYGKVSV